jgi:hypothetical protein
VTGPQELVETGSVTVEINCKAGLTRPRDGCDEWVKWVELGVEEVGGRAVESVCMAVEAGVKSPSVGQA